MVTHEVGWRMRGRARRVFWLRGLEGGGTEDDGRKKGTAEQRKNGARGMQSTVYYLGKHFGFRIFALPTTPLVKHKLEVQKVGHGLIGRCGTTRLAECITAPVHFEQFSPLRCCLQLEQAIGAPPLDSPGEPGQAPKSPGFTLPCKLLESAVGGVPGCHQQLGILGTGTGTDD